jgi:phosphotriesterase-related protein
MHEHVFVLTPDSEANWSTGWDEEANVAEAVVRLTALRGAGVQTIVDPTVDGLGRDVRRLLRVTTQVPDLHVVVATGVYTYTDVPNFFALRGPGLMPGLPDPMVECFVDDITQGIQGTGVRAAFLKCAIDHHGLTSGVERVMRACAQAHLRTGAPIMVHTHPGNHTGLHVQKILGDEGVDPRRVLLAHSGDSTDADHLASLAADGFTLGMDRFGIDLVLGFDDRVDIVAELCRRGFADQMVLSQDASCFLDWMAPETAALLPNWHYLHVSQDVLPYLREHGVPESDIDLMLTANPARILAG